MMYRNSLAVGDALNGLSAAEDSAAPPLTFSISFSESVLISNSFLNKRSINLCELRDLLEKGQEIGKISRLISHVW
jgi:hypothetical protein